MLNPANPSDFLRLAKPVIPALAAVTALLLGLGLYLAFFVAPPDYQQGESVRIMYLHVPAAWLAMFIYMVMTASAFGTLVFRHPLADAAQKAAAPLGAGFTFVCLATGSLWGKPMWGTWWVWDARLTSVLVLFLHLSRPRRDLAGDRGSGQSGAHRGRVHARRRDQYSDHPFFGRIGGTRCISRPRSFASAARPSRRPCSGRCSSWPSPSRFSSSLCI